MPRDSCTVLHELHILFDNIYAYSDFQASCNAKAKSVERHLMCSVSVRVLVQSFTMYTWDNTYLHKQAMNLNSN